ncbi:unnamed protein product [Cuscuta campestris]|uniref:Uncharacterized protein n=1 Tax=Cuscuta campestris TaxID=132261 RepID=A0A484K927_9ASTE|nr:unnamed protein product [Cuscuta campestris]
MLPAKSSYSSDFPPLVTLCNPVHHQTKDAAVKRDYSLLCPWSAACPPSSQERYNTGGLTPATPCGRFVVSKASSPLVLLLCGQLFSAYQLREFQWNFGRQN